MDGYIGWSDSEKKEAATCLQTAEYSDSRGIRNLVRQKRTGPTSRRRPGRSHAEGPPRPEIDTDVLAAECRGGEKRDEYKRQELQKHW